MKMKIASPLLFLVLFSVAFNSGCGKSQKLKSNINTSEIEEKENLHLRIQKSEELRKTLSVINKLLNPIYAYFDDIGKTIDLSLDADASEHLTFLFKRLRGVLREAAQGLVQFQEDGSWVVERKINLDNIENEKIEWTSKACLVKIKGTSAKKTRPSARSSIAADANKTGDSIQIFLQDCNSREEVEIASAKVNSSEMLQLHFLPRNLKKFFPKKVEGNTASVGTEAELGACHFDKHSNKLVIDCEPIHLALSKHNALISPVHITLVDDKIDALIRATVQGLSPNREAHPLAIVQLEAKPGSKPSIKVCLANKEGTKPDTCPIAK